MPFCPKCELNLLDSDFYIRGHTKRLHSYCKKCFCRYKIIQWNLNKINAIKYLGGSCKKCGFVGHPALYDFHHRDPNTKEADWQDLRKRSWDKIIIELDKCDLLCCCCHRMEHVVLEQWPISH